MTKVTTNSKTANSQIVLSEVNHEYLVKIINFDDELMSLTSLWKTAGGQREKAPNFWLNQESTIQLAETVCQMLNATRNCIIKSKRGRGGGTYAHKNIALAYAKYLDPKLHVLVNEVFFERVEEEKNPDIIADRYIKTYKKRGKSDKWINERMKGRMERNQFTSTLSRHGVEREGYRNCTNAIFSPLCFLCGQLLGIGHVRLLNFPSAAKARRE